MSVAGNLKFKFKSKEIGGETEKDIDYEWEVFAHSSSSRKDLELY